MKLSGVTVLIESVQFDLGQEKNKLKDLKKSLTAEIESLKKQVSDAAKGIRAASIVKQKLQSAMDEEKKDEVPSAEFLKAQETIKEHERRLE